jgi:hypothetical protein
MEFQISWDSMAGSQILIQDNSISSKKFNAQLTGPQCICIIAIVQRTLNKG